MNPDKLFAKSIESLMMPPLRADDQERELQLQALTIKKQKIEIERLMAVIAECQKILGKQSSLPVTLN